jgi:hypothetical protein
MTDEIVKKCTYCQMSMTARQIVDEPTVRPIGTAFFEDGGPGTHYYFFQHETPDCGTSFVVDVEHFKQFIAEPIPEKVLTLGPTCEGNCASILDLDGCGQECHFAPFRRFLFKMLAAKNAKSQRVSRP